jgi:hypothetical protein
MWDRIALVAALAACGGDGSAPVDGAVTDGAAIDAAPRFEPGAAMLLSTASPGNDEDPAVLLARDGSIYVAWFSESAGNDIVVSRTVDGVAWSTPVHISSGAATDFGPTLYQDPDGVIHAAWFRWASGAPPGTIVHAHATSPDSVAAWTAEVDVTTANATDDWVPSLAAGPTGALVVAFARNTCPPPSTCYAIVAASSTDLGASWSAPVPVVSAGGGVQHHLPAIANTGSELVVAWDPWDSPAASPYASLQTGAHISVIHSATGATWSGTTDLTAHATDAITVFPTLFADHAGAWHAAWLAADASGQRVVEVPLASPGTTPATLPIDGYSPRVVATPTPGVFLAAWVGGPANERDIYVRVY